MVGNCVVVKTVSQEGEEGGCVEKSDDIGMSYIGVQGFATGIMRWQAIDGLENTGIGSVYEFQVQG